MSASRILRQVLGAFPPSTRTLQDVGNLTIIDVALRDDGVYECVASNLAASIVTVTVLIVHCQCCRHFTLLSTVVACAIYCMQFVACSLLHAII